MTIEDYIDGKLVFLEADITTWNKKEKSLIQRYNTVYSRCKNKHNEVYNKFLTLYKSFIMEKSLEQLTHSYTAQINELMNKSICAKRQEHLSHYVTRYSCRNFRLRSNIGI